MPPLRVPCYKRLCLRAAVTPLQGAFAAVGLAALARGLAWSTSPTRGLAVAGHHCRWHDCGWLPLFLAFFVAKTQGREENMRGKPKLQPVNHDNIALGGPASSPPLDENVPSYTPNRYWSLFNDPGLSPLEGGAVQPTISPKAFFSLTQYVQALTGMVQSIIPLIPQASPLPRLTSQVVPSRTLPLASQPGLFQAHPVLPDHAPGLARIWYSRLKPLLVSSFDQLAKEFEFNFLVSVKPKPSAATLLGLSQRMRSPSPTSSHASPKKSGHT
ncbi:hypothetical protein B296_00019158 [Ensete ventricosum]|uniref:Retrotransposon gag domain-containing protein n=1 Tax=Ensete ventricosum TaxID=4639 RepID=A0A427APP8_ENSVE|nr:hypothetical protein B296_00019158 [Ensete ventricosum]